MTTDREPATAATLERVTVELARYISHDENPPAEAVAAHREAAQLLWGPRQDAAHRWHRQGTGWWCCVCENQCHKSHPCIDHAPCVPVPKATLCGGHHAD